MKDSHWSLEDGTSFSVWREDEVGESDLHDNDNHADTPSLEP
jgi:hypothetical protein